MPPNLNTGVRDTTTKPVAAPLAILPSPYLWLEDAPWPSAAVVSPLGFFFVQVTQASASGTGSTVEGGGRGVGGGGGGSPGIPFRSLGLLRRPVIAS